MKFKWTMKEINTADDVKDICNTYKQQRPVDFALDTETTGLHIIQDTPFIVQFGWTSGEYGYAFGLDLHKHPETFWRPTMRNVMAMAERAETFVGHNIKFDLHMLKNIGIDYVKENMTDTMFYIRYGHDAIAEAKGGAPLRLKDYAARYITPDARLHEQTLARERTAIAAHYNGQLKKIMGMRKKDIDAFFKDVTNDIDDMTTVQRDRYLQWREQLPDWLSDRFDYELKAEHIPYHKLNREQVMQYAMMDIVLTLETLHQLKPIVEVRQNTTAIEFENKLILPLLDMERVGFKIDKDYLNSAQRNMKDYIKERRAHLVELAGQPVSIGQHALVKAILHDEFNILASSTNSETLSRIEADLRHLDPDHPAADFISTLQELRTLEKWYSTYILRFKHALLKTDRLYTTINQVGTVSGRVTSDFQQFPKDTIKTNSGQPLFSPRHMVIADKEGEYNGLVYLDYSQIELRLQAMYTILVSHPEPNLCRAYMPFNCHRPDGTPFDPTNNDHINSWHEDWYLDESPEVKWEPIDVHAATTCHAFNVTPTDPDFKKLRYHGKRINFAKNYGAQFNRIKQMFPEYDDEQIRQIDQAYYKAFPGVKAYHDYCYRLAMLMPYGENLLGVRYYNVSGHNLINMLIQGSGAFFLKWKIRQLWEYTKANNIKSRFQMNIHDELSWEKHKDEDDVFYKFKEIMEDWSDSLVPIIADMEVSYSTWADKKEVTDPAQLRGE